MALRFFGTGGSEQSSCPSVSVDDKDGSFVFVGYSKASSLGRPMRARNPAWKSCRAPGRARLVNPAVSTASLMGPAGQLSELVRS
jgi:hypothetical protein